MTSLHHIGYWVDDLDAAMKQWQRDLDVGPFHVIEHVTFEAFTLLTPDGQHELLERDVVDDVERADA